MAEFCWWFHQKSICLKGKESCASSSGDYHLWSDPHQSVELFRRKLKRYSSHVGRNEFFRNTRGSYFLSISFIPPTRKKKSSPSESFRKSGGLTSGNFLLGNNFFSPLEYYFTFFFYLRVGQLNLIGACADEWEAYCRHKKKFPKIGKFRAVATAAKNLIQIEWVDGSNKKLSIKNPPINFFLNRKSSPFWG